MITNEWLMGFIEGEGSFIYSPRRATKDSTKLYPRFIFSITQKEYNVLVRVKEFLYTCNIHSTVYINKQDKEICWLHVQDKTSLYNLCKFLDKQSWVTDVKYNQYIMWKNKIIEWFNSGQNKRVY